VTAHPWWIARAQALNAPADLGVLAVGELWRLRERLEFLHLNVEPKLLALDVVATPDAAQVWDSMLSRTRAVDEALKSSLAALGRRMQSGELDHGAFCTQWQSLGYARHGDSGGSPADDFLDAMFHLSRLESGDERPPEGNLNLSSRAERIADFLTAMNPGPSDVVFDLGSGGGKVALTVAASTECHVHGVELIVPSVDDSRRAATFFGMHRATFTAGDVRDVDLSPGTIFYLYFPFRGSVAEHVAGVLARLAAHKAIHLYVAGPALEFGDYFLAHVEAGVFTLTERRGEFGEVLILRSASPSSETPNTH
jgi:Histone methylation protein DOT1